MTSNSSDKESKNSQRYSTIHYRDYLGLNQILTAQHPRSLEIEGESAHEEMLFIVVHQVYELWFKQIIHELESVLSLFHRDKVDERSIGTSIIRLNRVIEILKLLIEQIRIMETMTPLDFLDFRNYLFPASGFQSYQFRKIENLMGLQEDQRLTYNGCPYSTVFSPENQEKLRLSKEQGSLFDAMHSWLERTPFIQIGEFNFLSQYRLAVDRMLESEKQHIADSKFLTNEEKNQRLQMLGNSNSYYKSVFDEENHRELYGQGQTRLSYEANMAALLINLYRDEPILHLPFRLLNCFIEIDDAFTTWRFRHAQMVLRMLGNKIGTGGSSGHNYLSETVSKHSVFKDLHNISTLLIPRSELPKLPNEIKQQLGYYYTYNHSS